MSAELRALDTEARRLAQTSFERPLVLEAGAGTGKTATLVARVVAWVLGPGWVEAERECEDESSVARRVLEGVSAITFTEAAAAEMATRIAQALSALERGDQAPPGLELHLLACAETERSSRARALLGALDRLGVRTIHAACLRLVAEHPLEAGLPPRFEVDAKARALAEVAREVVEELLREDSGLTRSMLELAAREVQPDDVVVALTALVRAGVPVDEVARDRYPSEAVDAMRRELVAGFRAFIEGAGAHLVTLAGPGKACAAAMAELAAWLDTFEGLPADRLRLTGEAAELPSGLAKKLARWRLGEFGKTEAKEASHDPAAIVAALERPAELVDLLRGVRLEILDPARHLLAPLLERTRTQFHARGLVSYDDLLVMARDLLRDRPELRRRERSAVRQLLVDEFQDTDAVQCELVGLLGLPGDDEGPCPGLFLVGDPKQSIYGWRSADLEAYDGFKERVQQAGGQVLPLHVNFRSVPAILEEVRRLVEPVMERRQGLQPGFEALLACEQLAAEKGFESLGRAPVEHWDARPWLEPSGEGGTPSVDAAAKTGAVVACEAAAIARDILALHVGEGVGFGELAILLRTTTHQEHYLDALRRRGIPFEVGKDKSYYRRREIVDAGALVRTVLDPQDQLALLTWLRSPGVGVPDLALVPLWSHLFPDACARLAAPGDRAAVELAALLPAVAASLPETAAGLPGIEGWERSLAFALEVLAALRQDWTRLPVDELVDRMRHLTAVEAIEAARWLGGHRAANLDRFFRELEEELGDPRVGAHQVLRRLRQAVAQEEEAEEGRPRHELPDAVQVMTIHSAKGLDFGQVYLPRLEHPPNRKPGPNTAARRLEEGWELRLFGSSSPGWPARVRADGEVERAERVRLLYVASTRAKRRLVLSGRPRPARPADEADELAQLVAHREGGLADFDRAFELGAAEHGRWTWSERGATWLSCGLAAPEEEPGRRDGGDGLVLPAAAEVDAAVLRLEERRREARLRQARPWTAAASSLGGTGGDGRQAADPADPRHLLQAADPRDPLDPLDPLEAAGHSADEETTGAERLEREASRLLGGTTEAPAADREGEGSPEPGRGAPPRSRGAARAAGTAVHRALEILRLDGGPERLLEEAEATLSLARSLAAPAERELAARATRELLTRLAEGPCLRRLLELGEEGVLARELPLVLAPSGDEGAVGCLTGSVDLVYRDPDTGEVVVADHKTERAETEAEIAESLQRHGPQLAVYRKALQAALRLDEAPRAELWLLWPGRILALPPS